MEYRIDKATLYQAIGKYGRDKQLFMLFEEMSELQKEVCKVVRDKGCEAHCEEEIADVLIMIEQLKIMMNLNETNIQNVIDHKMSRLLRNVDGCNASYIKMESHPEYGHHQYNE